MWESVRKIAGYKQSDTKIELFYFLAMGWLRRAMAALKDEQKQRDWWGRDDIDLPRNISNLVKLTKLFSHWFERELGYASAAAWPIYERSDSGLGKVMSEQGEAQCNAGCRLIYVNDGIQTTLRLTKGK